MQGRRVIVGLCFCRIARPPFHDEWKLPGRRALAALQWLAVILMRADSVSSYGRFRAGSDAERMSAHYLHAEVIG